MRFSAVIAATWLSVVALGACTSDAIIDEVMFACEESPCGNGWSCIFSPELGSKVCVECAGCHGDSTSLAPPSDTQHNTDVSLVSVGAHRSHVGPSDWHAEIRCHQCHVVPLTTEAAGHNDSDLPAEVTFGPLATSNGAAPVWENPTCTGTYCHGTMAGGLNPVPTWTRPDGSQINCSSCHGEPPPPPHPIGRPTTSSCGGMGCHPPIIGDQRQSLSHINGQVDIEPAEPGECVGCHGDADSLAPPTDIAGNDAVTETGVGAHRSHLRTSDWHGTITCDQCHVVPQHMHDEGHQDTALPAEVVFGDLATTNGATPTWSGESCAQTYCHGGHQGGLTPAPRWTEVNGTQISCSSCHGNPPPMPHPQTAAPGGDLCSGTTCHPSVIGGGSSSNQHVNGTVEVILP